MKIKVLSDVSGAGKFRVGEEIEAIVNMKFDMAMAFDNDPTSNCAWTFCSGNFSPVTSSVDVQTSNASLVSVIGAKPARINIEF